MNVWIDSMWKMSITWVSRDGSFHDMTINYLFASLGREAFAVPVTVMCVACCFLSYAGGEETHIDQHIHKVQLHFTQKECGVNVRQYKNTFRDNADIY